MVHCCFHKRSNTTALYPNTGIIPTRQSQGRQLFDKQRSSLAPRQRHLDRFLLSPLEEQQQSLQIHERLAHISPNGDISAYISLLQDCRSLEQGRAIHRHIAHSKVAGEPYVHNLLLKMYGRCRRPDEARLVFDSMPLKNSFSWNLMLTAYSQAGHLEEAKTLFDSLPHPDTVASNIMLAMYGKYGRTNEAAELFSEMPTRDAVAWNTLMTAYAQCGHFAKALCLYRSSCLEGLRHDHIAFISVLEACSRLKALEEGRRIHHAAAAIGCGANLKVVTAIVNFYSRCDQLDEARKAFDGAPEKDAFLWTAMVTAYAQAGHLQDAEDLFTQMPGKDAVSWTAMMAAYSRNGHPTQALRVFRQMDLEGIHPTGITFITALDACAMIPSLALGRIIAATIDFVEPRLDPAIQSCLLQLYGRCGALGDAKAVFDSMCDRNVVTWSSIIAANAQNGHGHRALELFYSMLLDGVLPVEITLISVLHACCHSGLSGNAPQFFQSIAWDFELRPIADHFVCMIDVFGRSGEIENAADLIASMPFEPNAVAWTILLNACRMHKDVERAKRITDRIVRLDGSWQYALLTGIHAENEKVVN